MPWAWAGIQPKLRNIYSRVVVRPQTENTRSTVGSVETPERRLIPPGLKNRFDEGRTLFWGLNKPLRLAGGAVPMVRVM